MKRGDVVWPCYDAKMARGVPGIVIKTKQKAVLVRFKPWVSEDPNKIIEVWFSKRLNTLDRDWSVLKTNRVNKYGPRYLYSAWARQDDSMELFIGAGRGTYYLLRTHKRMTIHGYPLPMKADKIERILAELRA